MNNYQILDTNEELHPVCLGEYETYNEAYTDFKAMGGFNKGSGLIISKILHNEDLE